MYENVYLLDHTPNVIKSGDKYVVDYGSGSCTYEYRTIGKRIKQKVLLMTESNMGGVIDEVNKKSPLTEGDFFNLQFEIREDSLTKLKDYISSGSVSDT